MAPYPILVPSVSRTKSDQVRRMQSIMITTLFEFDICRPSSPNQCGTLAPTQPSFALKRRIWVCPQIQWNPIEMSSMSMVLQRLEGDFKSLVIPPKPFVSLDDEMDAN
ncbi:hypothetical protein Patl1_15132 [Pistacia atlantica]|uniref:Uncharacterized protein n=1 Tax=Pistacia atlantica TaxID=434234 RepID=A0ACC1BBA4_9ROSI|nr:hypothetical protein Patl1_15132 [Pistacia atlantica]